VRAAVGERVQPAGDAEEADAVASDLEHPHGALLRRVRQR
jgi:hypothetical protein